MSIALVGYAGRIAQLPGRSVDLYGPTELALAVRSDVRVIVLGDHALARLDVDHTASLLDEFGGVVIAVEPAQSWSALSHWRAAHIASFVHEHELVPTVARRLVRHGGRRPSLRAWLGDDLEHLSARTRVALRALVRLDIPGVLAWAEASGCSEAALDALMQSELGLTARETQKRYEARCADECPADST